jgi:hypothetical protein
MKPLLRGSSWRDVRHEPERQEALIALDVAQADLNGKLDPVLAATGELESKPHGSHPRIGEEVTAMSDVSISESLRE